MDSVVIVDAVRSPMGRGEPGGALAQLDPARLVGQIVRGQLDRTGLDASEVDEVIVAGPGLKSGIRREAGLLSTVPVRTGGRCGGSSQRVIHDAVRRIQHRDSGVVIVAAAESMSRVPPGSTRLVHRLYGTRQARHTPEMAHRGLVAELVAARWQLGRRELDEYAARSRERAVAVSTMGEFGPEIVPVSVRTSVVRQDETVLKIASGLASCQPLFYDERTAQRYPGIGWHLTEGNSFQVADGASATLVAREDRAGDLGLRPRARFVAVGECAGDQSEACGPIRATQAVLRASGIDVAELDHYEIGETYASIPLAWQKAFDASPDLLNPRGGAISLGHPVGASGIRSMATMLNALEATGGRYGLQAMEGAGTAGDAAVIERVVPRRWWVVPTHGVSQSR